MVLDAIAIERGHCDQEPRLDKSIGRVIRP
jgi:hypothetical protein